MKKNNAFAFFAVSTLLFLGACATKPSSSTNANWPTAKTSDEAQALDTPDKNNAPINIVEAQIVESNEASMRASKAISPVTSNQPSALSLIDIGDRVYFNTDAFTLTNEARQILAKQAHFLMQRPNVKVLIAGNCDERGTREYNLALGARRANSVKDYLISLGVGSNQITTVSYGKERPVDTRPSNDGWAVNRNAHTKIK